MPLAKIFKALFCFLLLLILSVKSIQAQVVINEFSSYSTGNDWIELYNTSQTEINLNGWKIKDSATTAVEEFKDQVLIPAGGYCLIEANKRLNKEEDKIELYQSEILKDCVTY